MGKKILRKQLGCPSCGARLIDAVFDIESELVAEGGFRPGWKPDYIQKCPKCKKQIGIKKVKPINKKAS